MFSFRAPNHRYQSEPFAPVRTEYTHFEFEVDGEIPAELDGTYIRNGPNPAGKISRKQHYFSGDGMVHGVRIRNGQPLWYRNRFVRVGDVPKVLGSADPGGPVSSKLDVSPNTNVVQFGSKLYATIEAGPSVVELSEELQTVARSDLNGALQDGFTGHHKIDPDDGDVHGVVYSNALGKNALYLRLTAKGEVLNRIKVPLAGSTQIHDMAITKHFAIILDLNVTFDLWMLLKTSLPIRWNEKKPCRVGIVPKDGSASDVRWFEVDPCYVYHPMNAFEEDGKLILDVSRYAHASKTDLYGPLGDTEPAIWRWIFDLDAPGSKAEEHLLVDRALDFPKISPCVEGRPYRYGYGVEASLQPSFDGAIKMDLKTGAQERQDFDGGMASELSFIPRPDSSAEDDGWLMGFVYQPQRRQSRLVILDAQHFSQPPQASIWIPEHHVPIGTHGSFFPAQ
ncbi:MAG: carotenoid oxygenase family protein [Pseudomonadota bacterium]